MGGTSTRKPSWYSLATLNPVVFFYLKIVAPPLDAVKAIIKAAKPIIEEFCRVEVIASLLGITALLCWMIPRGAGKVVAAVAAAAFVHFRDFTDPTFRPRMMKVAWIGVYAAAVAGDP
ncbi:hypothetical protein TWF506_005940 [Arthrobotrys conoides]|uniref:Uncharacterized protein n=1 Tax=Arthrobotrys conoides TaxID=74498 RepID=A0AAN8NQ48_9PEZI